MKARTPKAPKAPVQPAGKSVNIGPVGTELVLNGADLHAGFVDSIDVTTGVQGWAVNLHSPLTPVDLELCVGDIVVARITADAERDDIAAKLGCEARAGFVFPPDLLPVLSACTDDLDAPVLVRIAANGRTLAGAAATPRLADILAALRAGHSPSPATSIADLDLLLESLCMGAASLAEKVLRPIPEGLQGYIETLAVDPTGKVWFMGWMKKGHLHEFSAVIVERQKSPAALAVMNYGRDDLPQDCCGLVGLMSSAWRPSSATTELHLFFGSAGKFHLKSHAPLRIIPVAELVAEYEGVRDRCFGDSRTVVLQRMLASLKNWIPTRSIAQNFATDMSVDRILLVPGLGCLVEGWVMSPIKRVEALRLRVGGAVMLADPDSLYWKPRPDLLAAFPGAAAMIARAGFVGLFTGDAEPEDFSEPTLKIIFQGAHSTNAAIAPAVFRRLGHSATLEDALQFFPALKEEVFFPRFAAAAIRAERSAMNAPVPLSIVRARAVLVVVLPEDRCDLFLFFEDLAEQCRGPSAAARPDMEAVAGRCGIEAIAFVASSRHNRSDALWLFRDFKSAYGEPNGIACSLLVIDDTAHAFALLPDLLREIGASRFVFASSGVFLNREGWGHVLQTLAPGASGLVFFGIEAEAFEHRSVAEGISARCFAWSVAPFARWALHAPAFLGGYFHDNGLLSVKDGYVVHHKAARATRTPLQTRIQEAVNDVVYRSVMPAPTEFLPGPARHSEALGLD